MTKEYWSLSLSVRHFYRFYIFRLSIHLSLVHILSVLLSIQVLDHTMMPGSVSVALANCNASALSFLLWIAMDCHGLPQELQLPYGLPWVKTCKHNTDTKHMTSLCIWVAKHLITGGIDSAHIMLEFARLVRYKYDAMKLQPWCSTDSLTSNISNISSTLDYLPW